MAASAAWIEGFMVSSVRRRVLCRYFRESGCFLRFLTLKNQETQKQNWKQTYLYLVTDRLDRY